MWWCCLYLQCCPVPCLQLLSELLRADTAMANLNQASRNQPYHPASKAAQETAENVDADCIY
jgi:hypothetical protein